MAPDDIPHPVRILIQQHVHSFERLQLLLLLVRSPAPLTLDYIAGEVKLPTREVHDTLAQLAQAGLVDAIGRDRWTCRTSDPAVRALARSFDENPVRLLHWMSKHAIERARRSVTVSLADLILRRRQ